MRTKVLMLGLICLFLIACDKDIENPYSPPLPIEPKEPADVRLYDWSANFYIDSSDSSKAEWRIWGKLMNAGELPAKDIKVNSRIYDISFNILWSGSFLFMNPTSNSSYLDGEETHDFVASWKGLDSNLFNEWDPTKTYGSGVKITWED